MRVRVLGSAAGGGFPQWNCGCANCAGVRLGAISAKARTQESVAIGTGRTGDASSWAPDDPWFLINASPEIRQQLESFPALWPRARRHWPVAGILLTNGDLDHCLGLLSLRESHPLVLYATPAVKAGFIEGNVLYGTLQRFAGQVQWRDLVLGKEMPLGDATTGLFVTPVPAPGKMALHLETSRSPSPEDNVGFVVRDSRTGGRLAYFSGTSGRSAQLDDACADADAVFFDGTFWSSDELIAAGLGTRRAEDMAHWPQGGPQGSLAFLAQLRAHRRILIHVNNTNPILREDSAENRMLAQSGVEVAVDGMELAL